MVRLSIKQGGLLMDFDFESCWLEGKYEDQPCDMCPYKEDCSGFGEGYDED